MEKGLQEANANLLKRQEAERQHKVSGPEQVAGLLPVFETRATSGPDKRFACEVHRSEELPCEQCEWEKGRDLRARQVTASKLFKDILIGKRYMGKTFDDYLPPTDNAVAVKEKCMKFVQTLKNRLDNGDSLLMLGEPGTGKNMLSACICQAAVAQGFTALHTTAMKLVRKIKTSWGNLNIDEQEMIDLFAKPDILVIDEIGKQFGSLAEEILLFEAINGRYEEMRSVILISNLGEAGVADYLGPTLIDRFHEGKSSLLTFDWPSYRRR